MVRYTILRLMVFFGCVSLLWLLGLRSPEQRFILVLGAALLSVVISWFALRRFREDYSVELAQRIEKRMARKAGHTDEDAEDAEIDFR